jgi:biopolymer transport protein TolQ
MKESVNFLSIISNADIVVKSILFLLLILSIASWATFFTKSVRFFFIKNRMKYFGEFFKSSSLKDIYIKSKSNNSQFAKIFLVAINEFNLKTKEEIKAMSLEQRKFLKERMTNDMEIYISNYLIEINKSMHILAIIGSLSPFIGLFGTVWGIMNSFSAIAQTKVTGLAVVAPGIAEALFATAVGLFVAIPAVLFFNLCKNNINIINDRMYSFSINVLNLFSRNLDN